MYGNQARKMQQPQQAIHSQSDITAKDKLNGYIYEYLVHSGAKQAADAFKTEILQGVNMQISEAPGFLQNWWMVFWDLYAAAPESKNKGYDHSQEAKAFHEFGFIPNNILSNPPMMNGIHGASQFPNATQSPMGMPPGSDGMMPGYFRPSMQPGPSGTPTQSSPIAGPPPRYGHPHPGARGATPQPMTGSFPGPPHMFTNEMRMAAAQRINQGGPRMQAFPGIRPGMPPRYQSFIESPGAGSPFNQNNIMHNGPMSSNNPSLMSSPGPGGPGGPDLHDPARYGMMTSQFMPNDGIPHTPVSTSIGSNGPSGMDGSQLSNLLNGEHEMKQSPASVHGIPGNINGGTPGGGPGSQHNPPSAHGPASVQSQHGAQGAGQNPGAQNVSNQQSMGEANPMDFQQGGQQGGDHNGHDEQEISKIKSSLLEDFSKPDDSAHYGSSQHFG